MLCPDPDNILVDALSERSSNFPIIFYKMKICIACKKELINSKFYICGPGRKYLSSRCRKCYDFNRRRNNLWHRYKITVEDYDRLLKEQGGGCAICGYKPTGRRLSVDHNHKTGKVRGLLCMLCNKFIVGLIEKKKLNPQCVVKYFKKYGE